MIDKALAKHAREFQRNINNHNYEVTDSGIEFASAGVQVFGEYQDAYGTEKNMLPVQGLNHILMVALSSTAKAPGFYLALYTNNFTPTAGLTASQFASTAGELVSSSEGYADPTRRVWTPSAADAGAIDNYASKAEFNIVTASQITIRGAALLTDQTKGSTSGSIISATRFSNDRIEFNGNVYQLGYRVRLQST